MKTREYIDELRRKLLGIACECGDLDTINTLTDAESYLRSMADKIEAIPKEQELPDSPGFWWALDMSNVFTGWKLWYVKEPFWVDPNRHDLYFYHLDGGEGYPLKKGRWIKTEPPRP